MAGDLRPLHERLIPSERALRSALAVLADMAEFVCRAEQSGTGRCYDADEDGYVLGPYDWCCGCIARVTVAAILHGIPIEPYGEVEIAWGEARVPVSPSRSPEEE